MRTSPSAAALQVAVAAVPWTLSASYGLEAVAVTPLRLACGIGSRSEQHADVFHGLQALELVNFLYFRSRMQQSNDKLATRTKMYRTRLSA